MRIIKRLNTLGSIMWSMIVAISHKITKSWIYSNYPTTDVTFKECNFFVAWNEMILLFAA